VGLGRRLVSTKFDQRKTPNSASIITAAIPNLHNLFCVNSRHSGLHHRLCRSWNCVEGPGPVVEDESPNLRLTKRPEKTSAKSNCALQQRIALAKHPLRFLPSSTRPPIFRSHATIRDSIFSSLPHYNHLSIDDTGRGGATAIFRTISQLRKQFVG
jgi:hypothetical protein